MTKLYILALFFILNCSAHIVRAETNNSATIEIVEVLEMTYSSNPEVTHDPTIEVIKIANAIDYVPNNIYKSPFHHYQLRIPSVAGSTRLKVIQSLITRTVDGSPGTSNVTFIPDVGFGSSSLIVTRMRDDRPKDMDYVFSEFLPPTDEEMALAERRGVSYKKLETAFGATLQRSIKNRRMTNTFPYKVVAGKSIDSDTLGVSRFIVKDGYLLEFIVIADTRHITDSTKLQTFAESELDILMNSIIKFPNQHMHN